MPGNPNVPKLHRAFFLKSLMQGFFYPAILGNMVYSLLAVSASGQLNDAGSEIFVKFLMLIYITIFYLFDFIYLFLTRPFRSYMFLMDIIFIVFLYLTYSSLHLPTSQLTKPLNLDWTRVHCFFIAFLLLYLIWDHIEKAKSKDPNERSMYYWILGWEYVSLVLFTALVLVMTLGHYRYEGHLNWTYVALAVNLIGFGTSIVKKYQYWKTTTPETDLVSL